MTEERAWVYYMERVKLFSASRKSQTKTNKTLLSDDKSQGNEIMEVIRLKGKDALRSTLGRNIQQKLSIINYLLAQSIHYRH